MNDLINPINTPATFTPSNQDCAKVQDFFRNKVLTARTRITNNCHTDWDNSQPPTIAHARTAPDSQNAFNFKPITTDTTILTLKKMKPCPDKGELFPSKIILKYPDIFAPVLTRFINASFKHRHVPTALKTVRVSPIPKKPDADQTDPSNLRPITLVLFLLKLLDKIATSQFHDHLKDSKLLHKQQSGFRSGYSTETALLDLQTKMRTLIENNKAGLLVLLDLSAAYDLLDHQTLLKRLHSNFQCSTEACDWIYSFLANRNSKVTWGDAESPSETLLYGVPQGACLSPALFNTYTQPLFTKLEELGVVFTNYADDTQLLIELTGNHQTDSANLDHIYSTIKEWMNQNWMCLNGTKTELLIVATKDKRNKLGADYKEFLVEGTPILVASQVKTLGVIIDAQLNMTPHTNYIYKNSQFHLKRLRSIRPFLSENHSATITRAIILPRLDYCNSLLTNTSQANIHKLQTIQNEAARIIGRIAKRDHISHFRKQLHWLPVLDRISFKILCLTHKSIHNEAPQYLSSLISLKPNTRDLRSNNTGLLSCPRTTKKCGNGSSFITTGPSLWNNLPIDLRLQPLLPTFKKELKTYLFN